MKRRLFRCWMMIIVVIQCYMPESNYSLSVHYEPPDGVINVNNPNANDSRNETTSPACVTEECKLSDEIKASLNWSADACVNFYQFACGGWIRNHSVPKTRSHQNHFRIIEDKLHHQLKEMLENDELSDPVPVRAAGLFYRSCINIDRIEKESMFALTQMLKEYGGWPMASDNWDSSKFDWLRMTSDSIRFWSVMSLVYVYVGLDRTDTNRTVIVIDQPPSSALPLSMMLHPSAFNIQLEAYKQWIAASALSIAKYAHQNVSIQSIEQQASELLAFEIKLAELRSSNEMRKNELRMYNNMTLRAVQEWSDSAAQPSEKSNKTIDWLRLINAIFADTGMQIGYGESVIVKELDFLFHLTQLLNDTPPRLLANYLHWRMVKTVSRDSTDEMRTFETQFEQVFSGILSDEPRWKDCIASVTNTFGFAVGYKYVEKYFDENSKASAGSMVNDIIETFKNELSHADWMDEQTRSAAIQKVNSMAQFIAYPDWYSNHTALTIFYDGVTVGENHFTNVKFMRTYLYKRALLKLRTPTDRTQWVTGPAIVNAFHNGFTNSIILPAGILQWPFFDSKRPSALNYGSIGAIIGHEILHGFDDTGRLFDAYGNLAQWWTEETISAYENKTDCFVRQYNRFVVTLADHDNSPLSNLSVNGVITQGENIADNCGLRQAYYAYEKHRNEHREADEKTTLSSDIQQFTPNQLFFISYAMTWCESNTRESLMQEILDDKHSPHEIRVIGTLSNFPEFAEAFNCPENSPMNPSDKCIIW